MFGSQASQRPTAFQTLVSAGSYGATIPYIGGLIRTSPIPIWAQNLRPGGSDKKLKGKKKGPPTYVENVDYLIGQNPIVQIAQIWTNNNVKYPLNYVTTSVSAGGCIYSFTISDSNFNSIIAVTCTCNYNLTFNDYGAQGPVNYTGTMEIPLWNTALIGPDPLNNKSSNNWPNTYRWLPSYGPTWYYEPGLGCSANIPTLPGTNGAGATFKVYYTQKASAISHQTPLHKARLTFEPQLGDGPEYDTTWASQQIIYPQYAGAGSPDIDCGSAGVLPQLNLEVQGAHSLYYTGDADFVDFIEDIAKSGLGQAAVDVAASPGYTPIHHGININDFPGMVQHSYYSNSAIGGSVIPVPFSAPVTQGNILLAMFQGNNSFSNAVTDDLANTWNLLYDSGGIDHSYVSYALNATTGVDRILFPSGTTMFNVITQIAEIQGVNELDGVPISTNVSPGPGLPVKLSIVTTGQPSLLVCFSTGALDNPHLPPGAANDSSWIVDYVGKGGSTSSAVISLMHKVAPFPGVYTNVLYPGAGRFHMTLMAFKLSDPPNYPMPLGNILDPDSLELTRQQCRANGLWGSICMDSQKKGSDWIKDLCTCADTAPVYSGFTLKLIPYSEVSYVGNGGIYISPTSTGPVANFTESDFVADGSNPPITVTRKSQMDADNIFQIEHMFRGADYETIITSQPEPLNVGLYGPRKAAPVVLHMIQDTLVARKLVAIMVRKQTYLRLTYEFTLKANNALYEAMDLVTLTEPKMNFYKVPVRLLSVTEDANYNLKCTAEPFVYGCYAPDPAFTVTTPAPYVPNFGADPGSVNTPIIFEPVPRLSPGQNQPQLWFVVSGMSTAYGGSLVYVSTDGGNSYNSLGTITGNATTGFTVGDWPAAADPDTTNNLTVNLAESNGTLMSYTAQDRDEFTYPCYVAGGTMAIPYELMTYDIANLITGNEYTLPATGGGTNELRRAVFGAPTPNQGVDHPNNSRWAFLGAPEVSQPGILKVILDPKWIGVTLYFKFLAFNTFGGNAQTLSAATAYPYTPAGTVGTPNPNQFAYTVTPASPLSQTSNTNIHMVQTTANFPTNQTIYNARDFTIPAPSVPTTYWVTVYDPHFVGDTDAMTNLTASADPTTVHVGVDGYIYIGSITVYPGMSSPPIITPGGLPVSNTTLLTFDGV